MELRSGPSPEPVTIPPEDASLSGEAERRRREAEELGRVARALAESLDPGAVSQRIVDSLVRLFPIQYAVIRLCRPDGALVALASSGAARGQFEPGHVVPAGMGLAGRAVTEGQPVWVRDVLHEPTLVRSDDLRREVEAAGLRAMLAIPLRVKGTVVGVVIIGAAAVRGFSDAEVALLQAFADQAAVALENARLYKEAERRRREAEIFATLAESLNASLDLDTILARVADGAKDLCASDLARIALREPGAEAMGFRYWPGARYAGWHRVRIEPGKGTGGQVLVTGRPFRTDQYAEDARISHDYLEVARAEGTVAELVVPIRRDGRVDGLLFVSRRAPSPFTDHDEAILLRLADHAAIALQNAKLLQRLTAHQTRLEALLNVSRELSRIQPLASLLDRIAEACGRLLGTDSAGFRVLDGDELVVTGTWGDAKEAMATPRLKVGESLSGLVAATGQPLYVPDLAREPRLIPSHQAADLRLGHRAWLGLPVKAGERLLGVLSLRTRREQGFSVDDVAVAKAFASQAATALENARLFAEIRDNEARFRSAFEHSGIGMALQALDGRYLRVNPALCEMLGYAAPELLASTFHPVTHPEDRAIDTEYDRQMLAGERTWYQREKRYLHKLGHAVWALVAVSLIRSDDGAPQCFMVQVQDITARKELEDQLRQAQKMESVGRLAGGIAHDFNNLLTVITGRTELLQRRLPPDDPMRRSLGLIQETAARAALLTQQLLAFSRKQMLRPQVLDLNDPVAGMVPILRRLIGEDIELAHIARPALGRVKVDPAQLQQVILNLAVNARDAMPHGGRLTLETANVTLDAGFARRHVGATPGAYVMLAVGDTGVGMDAETQAHLFEPFFTTKGPGKGTGLGLATVYGIVKQHDAYIEVESAVGQGTTMRIYWPRIEAVPEGAEPRAPSGGAPRGSETILLVEDEAAVRQLAREILESHGYTVLEAPSPDEAVRLAAHHAGRLPLLVTDVVMPQMNGRELAERLRERRPEMRVLYMSGYTDDAIVHHGVLEPGVTLLPKPFTPDALARTVREVLETPVNDGGETRSHAD